MIEVTYLDDDMVNFENVRQDSQPTDSIRMSSALDMRKTSQDMGSQESLNSTGKMSMRVEKSLARKFKRKMLDNQKIQNRLSQMHVVDQLKYQKANAKRILQEYQAARIEVEKGTQEMNRTENPRWRRIQDKRKR